MLNGAPLISEQDLLGTSVEKDLRNGLTKMMMRRTLEILH